MFHEHRYQKSLTKQWKNQIQWYIKRIIKPSTVYPKNTRLFSIWKSMYISHINRKKLYMILSINAENTFDKIQHLGKIKMKKLLLTNWNYDSIKSIYKNIATSYLVMGDSAFLLRSGKIQKCLFSSLLFNIVLSRSLLEW